MENAIHIDNLRAIRDTARSAMASVGFKEWERIVTAQIEGRKASLLNPIKSLDEAIAQESMKGEALGLLQALKMWNLMLESIETDIAEAEAEAKPGDNNETTE